MQHFVEPIKGVESRLGGCWLAIDPSSIGIMIAVNSVRGPVSNEIVFFFLTPNWFLPESIGWIKISLEETAHSCWLLSWARRH